MKTIASLNIAHVVFSFDYGGLERRILRLIESLSERDCRFHVISLRPSDGRFLDMNYPVTHININAQPGLDIQAVRRVAATLKENNIHIAHSHNWVSMLEGTLAAKLARTPVCVHGEHGAKRFEPSELVWRRTATQKLLCRISDQIIPVNDAINERLQEVWGLNQNRLTTIRNGVDTEKFSPASNNQTSSDGLVHIGSVSRLDPVKNFPCLIRAVALLNRGTGPNKYHLTIVGDGAQKNELLALCQSLGISEQVSFPGATDNAAEWYPRFDIYVNSSFSEGMSNTVLEAMACGLPVVVTDVAGHRDWLVENDNALFFSSDNEADLASKLSEFAEDKQRRGQVGERNRSYIENHFSQHLFIERYQALYTKLLRKKGYLFDFSA